MTKQEAIVRIEEHKKIHKMDEPNAIYISEALDMAIEALAKNSTMGMWIPQPSNKGQDEQVVWWKCSECDHIIYSETEQDKKKHHSYCGRCGTKMFHQKTMGSRLTDMGKAIVYLIKEYGVAKDNEYVRKPVSYALYQTWRKWDEEEKLREAERDKE